jgi:hypothetical protein
LKHFVPQASQLECTMYELHIDAMIAPAMGLVGGESGIRDLGSGKVMCLLTLEMRNDTETTDGCSVVRNGDSGKHPCLMVSLQT